MPASAIPEDIRRFVLTSIPSVPFLEAMLVFRDHGAAPVATLTLAQRLYVSEQVAAELVEQLHAARIVQRVDMQRGTCRFAPASVELRALLDRVAQVYASNLIEMSHLIHSKTERTAHQFADAFMLRRGS